jgi:alkylhydroperoxidase/carboxymuconolactone decarboxylase family protein YurZ
MLPVLVAICLIQHNDPSDFQRLFHYFANSEKHSSTILLSKFVLRLRTALFKAVPLVGVPRVINALASLNEAVLSHEKAEQIMDELPNKSSKPTKTTEEDSIAGWAFFKAIYAQHAEKIIDNIGKTSPDLAEMIVDELYGANLSRKEVLSWKETVLIEFVGW